MKNTVRGIRKWLSVRTAFTFSKVVIRIQEYPKAPLQRAYN
jgi:hypothetical protein